MYFKEKKVFDFKENQVLFFVAYLSTEFAFNLKMQKELGIINNGELLLDSLINLGYDAKTLYLMQQVHSDNIIKYNGFNNNKRVVIGDLADAIMIDFNNKGIIGSVLSADCLPLIVVSSKLIIASHIGRRGLFCGLANKVIEKTKNLSDAIFILGNNICSNHYEVAIDFYEEALKNNLDLVWVNKSSEKINLDIKKSVMNLILKSGVNKNNIIDITGCTYEDKLSYSHRRGDLGRLVSGAMFL